MAGQGTTAPVHPDVREEAVLDLVPLADPRRQVTDRDRKPGFAGEATELVLPEARAVAAAAVGADRQALGTRTCLGAVAAPPASQALDGNGRDVDAVLDEVEVAGRYGT